MVKSCIYFPTVIYRNVASTVATEFPRVLGAGIHELGIEQQLFLVKLDGYSTSSSLIPFKQLRNSAEELSKILFISWETAGEVDCFLIYMPYFTDADTLAAAIAEEIVPTQPGPIGRIFGNKPSRLYPYNASLQQFIVKNGGFMLIKDHDGSYIELIGNGKSNLIYRLIEVMGRFVASIDQ